jgi:hypothetical protein
MMDYLGRAALADGHVQRVQEQFRAEMRRHGPSDDSTTPGVQHDGEEEEPGPRPMRFQSQRDPAALSDVVRPDHDFDSPIRSDHSLKRARDSHGQFLERVLRPLVAFPEIHVDASNRPVETIGCDDRNEVNLVGVDPHLGKAHQRIGDRVFDLSQRIVLPQVERCHSWHA